MKRRLNRHIKAAYLAIFRAIIPAAALKDSNKVEIIRWHVVICAHLIALIILPFAFWIETLVFGLFSLMTLINVMLYLSIGFSLWLIRRTGNSSTSATLIVCAAVFATTGTAILSSGVNDPALGWLIIAPVVASLMSHRRGVIVTTLLCLCSCAVLTYLNLAKSPADDAVRTSIALNYFIQFSIPILFSGAVGYIQWSVMTLAAEQTKKIQTELDLERQKSFHSQRLKSLGEMGAGIAHEINNPLAVIAGISQLILRKIELGTLTEEDAKRNTQKIIDTTDRISKIVKSMKRISGYKHFDEESSVVFTNLKDEIDAALAIQCFSMQNIETKIEGLETAQHVNVVIRNGELSQILVELITNSIHAIGKQARPWITLEVTACEHKADIRITDSGSGISTAVREKIFEPFFTTRQNEGGTGLGLGVIKSMVESYGGSIRYCPEVENTSFVVSLKIGKSVNEAA